MHPSSLSSLRKVAGDADMSPSSMPQSRYYADKSFDLPGALNQEAPEVVHGGVVFGKVVSSYREPSIERDLEAKAVKRHASVGLKHSLANVLGSEAVDIFSRIYLLDNSGSTSHGDGHMIVPRGGNGVFTSIPSTRWDEIKTMAIDQARWNASVGVRAEFMLLNPPCPHQPVEGRDFVVIDPQKPGAEQVAKLQRMLDKNGPRGTTPLVERLQQLRQRLKRQVPEGSQLMLTIVTDGLPTSTSGSCQQHDQHSFIAELRTFASTFNAFIVIRLATDDDDVVAFYNRIDEEVELPLDILDDLQGEAKEVSDCGNGWLAYTPWIHRIRESGTTEKMFDLLDERPFTLAEIAVFLEFLFREEDEHPFPREPQALLQITRQALQRSHPVFDGLKGQMAPAVDIKKLEKALRGKKSGQVGSGGGSSACSVM